MKFPVLWLFIIIAVTIIATPFLLHFSKKTVTPQNEVLKKFTLKSPPVRLLIPSINVDALVQHLGVTSQGIMESPNNIVDVGWFKLGPLPGEKGSAVIAGHMDGEHGEPGVFINLHKLKKDDKVYVQNSMGVSTAFIVRESRTYDPGYAEEVFSQNDTAHLNLITCDGIWDESKKIYDKRLVVFTDIMH